MELTDDAQSILLLCSRLGATDTVVTPKRWNDLALRIQQSTWKRPGALLDAPADTMASELRLPHGETVELRRLLDRGAALAFELDRLSGLGIWPLTRADADYPKRLKARLKSAAPPVLFGCGDRKLLDAGGWAVIGSRGVDEVGQVAATQLGEAAAAAGTTLISGGAKGVDGLAMAGALEAGGTVVGVLPDGLERAAKGRAHRDALLDGRLCFLTPYTPNAGFSVGNAMGRNKLIYALSDAAVVVASDVGAGGTWAGATEALKAAWVPVFALDHADAPAGNRALIERGAVALPWPINDLVERLRERRVTSLFG